MVNNNSIATSRLSAEASAQAGQISIPSVPLQTWFSKCEIKVSLLHCQFDVLYTLAAKI